jgi:hypothetical protein
MKSRKCDRCGTLNVASSNFCRNCGGPISECNTFEVDVTKAPQHRKHVIVEGWSSVGSVWGTLVGLFAWLLFFVILAGGFVGAYFMSQVEHNQGMGVLIFIGTSVVALFMLARIMASLNTAENIASMVDNTNQILKILAEDAESSR